MHQGYWNDLSLSAQKIKLLLEKNVPKYSHMLLLAIDGIVDDLLRRKLISREDDILRCIERTITNRNPRQSIVFDNGFLKDMDVESEEEIEKASALVISHIKETIEIPLNKR